MLLRRLISELNPAIDASALPDLEIRGICEDSRTAEPGDLFVARSGTKTDGASFIGDAAARRGRRPLWRKNRILPPPADCGPQPRRRRRPPGPHLLRSSLATGEIHRRHRHERKNHHHVYLAPSPAKIRHTLRTHRHSRNRRRQNPQRSQHDHAGHRRSRKAPGQNARQRLPRLRHGGFEPRLAPGTRPRFRFLPARRSQTSPAIISTTTARWKNTPPPRPFFSTCWAPTPSPWSMPTTHTPSECSPAAKQEPPVSASVPPPITAQKISG